MCSSDLFPSHDTKCINGKWIDYDGPTVGGDETVYTEKEDIKEEHHTWESRDVIPVRSEELKRLAEYGSHRTCINGKWIDYDGPTVGGDETVYTEKEDIKEEHHTWESRDVIPVVNLASTKEFASKRYTPSSPTP